MAERGSQRDGGYGWVVVFAFFTSSIIIDAMRYAFGLLYVEFLSEFNQGKGETAWIGSVLVCVNNILGPVLAAGINRFGVRVSAIAGSVIGTIGLVSSSFATKIYTLYFTYGIIQGVGLGLMFLSGWVAVSRYFEKKRGKALGIAQCGCGVGAFAVSPLLKIFIDEYTWRGAMLILAGVCLNGCVLAMLYRPFVDIIDCESEEINESMNDVNYEKNKMIHVTHNGTHAENKSLLLDNQYSGSGYKLNTDSFKEKHKFDNTNDKSTNHKLKRWKLLRNSWCFKDNTEPGIPKTFAEMREEQLKHYKLGAHNPHLASVTWSSNRSVNSINISPIVLGSNASLESILAKRRMKTQLEAKVTDVNDTQQYANNTQNQNKHLVNQKQFSWSWLEKLFPKQLVTDIKLILMMVSAFFYCMPTFIPISLLPDYGRIVGCAESEVVWFVSAIGIGGTIGRVLCGIVVDIACLNRIWFLGAMLLMCSVSSLLLPLLTSFLSLIIFSFTYGLCIGSLYVVPCIILMDLFGEELIPQSIGVYMYVGGTASVLGVPVAGWLFDATESYTASFLFCGGLYMCALISNLFVLCVPNKQTSKKTEEERTV